MNIGILKKKALRGICLTASIIMTVTVFAGCSGDKAAQADMSISPMQMKEGAYEYATNTASVTTDYDYGYSDEYFMEDAACAPEMEMEYSKATAASGSMSGQTSDIPQVDLTGRKLITTVNISMQTLQFDIAVAEIESRAAALGGYIQSSSISNNGGVYLRDLDNGYLRSLRYAYYTVRIPSQLLDSFTDSMGNIGTVTDKSLNTQDITLEYVDNEARAESLRIQQERLLALLEKADKITDVIELESRLSDVIYQLERKESVLRNYDNLVEFSTVYVNVSEVERITYEEPLPKTVGERIASGLENTWYSITEGIKDFFVWFIVNIPYIVFWCAVIAAAVVVIVKKTKKVLNKRSGRSSAVIDSEASDKDIK